METFKAWDPDDGDEDDAHTIEAHDAEYAAEKDAEDNWSGDDYPENRDVNVRDAAGALTRWRVSAQPSVHFSATPRKDAATS